MVAYNKVRNANIIHAANAAAYTHQQTLLAGKTDKQALDAAAVAAAASTNTDTENRIKNETVVKDNNTISEIKKRSAEHTAEYEVDMKHILADNVLLGTKSKTFYEAHTAMTAANRTLATQDTFSAAKISLFSHADQSLNFRKNAVEKTKTQSSDAKNKLSETNYILDQMNIALSKSNTTELKDSAYRALSIRNAAADAYDKSTTEAKTILDDYTYFYKGYKNLYNAYEYRIAYPGYTFHRHMKYPEKDYNPEYVFDTQGMAAKIKRCDEVAICDAVQTDGWYANAPEHNLSNWVYDNLLDIDSGTYVKNTYRDKLMPSSTRSVSSDYTFYHNYYIPNNTIGNADSTNMINMLTTCSANSACNGIDSRGDMIGRIPPQWSWVRGPADALSDAGTYVKNQYAQLIV
jgi:hypothetical protein